MKKHRCIMKGKIFSIRVFILFLCLFLQLSVFAEVVKVPVSSKNQTQDLTKPVKNPNGLFYDILLKDEEVIKYVKKIGFNHAFDDLMNNKAWNKPILKINAISHRYDILINYLVDNYSFEQSSKYHNQLDFAVQEAINTLSTKITAVAEIKEVPCQNVDMQYPLQAETVKTFASERTFIENVIGDGKTILTPEYIIKIYDYDTFYTNLWLPLEDVLIVPDYVINIENGEKAEIEEIILR